MMLKWYFNERRSTTSSFHLQRMRAFLFPSYVASWFPDPINYFLSEHPAQHFAKANTCEC